MKLTILGSGTCVPTVRRGSPANYLEIGKKKILIDCGPGTVRQIVSAKIDYRTIDMVFLTHFHNDYVSDLVALTWALFCTQGFDRKKDLTLIGPVGFKKFFETCINLNNDGEHWPRNKRIKIKEIKNRIEFEEFSVECKKIIHTSSSIAYKFIEKDKTLIFSGDCDYDEKFINFSKDADILLLECSYPNNIKKRGHLIPKECGLIAQRARVKKLILTHIYAYSSGEVRLDQTKKIFKNTILAEDFMKINI